ncbi:MAG: hypothetical protein AAB263_16550 [Planctomycetota bacterium]
MPDPAAKSFFVLTLRGDRGPVDRTGVRELLRSGEARAEDQVRDIFGRSQGTVSSLLAARDRETSTERIQNDQRRVAHHAGGSRSVLIVVALSMGVLGMVVTWGFLTRNTVIQSPVVTPAPAPSTQSNVALSQPVAVVAPVKSDPRGATTVQVQLPQTTPVVETTKSPTPSCPSSPVVPVMTETPSSVPVGWTARNLGAGAPGSGTTVADGIWTLRGYGHMFGTGSDSCHMATTPLVGDGAITVRLVNIVASDLTLAGIIVRSTENGGDPAAYLCVNGTPQIGFGYRTATSQRSEGRMLLRAKFPLWLRMVRRATEISAWISDDAKIWTPVGSPVALPTFTGPLLAGLVVCGASRTNPTRATFTDVSVGPLPVERSR